MLGAIFGDIAGSEYEVISTKSKDFDLYSEYSYFTDDTVMTVAVADTILQFEKITDVDSFKYVLVDRMRKLGNQYPNAGYGGAFKKWLKSDDPQPYNSFGNGSAMRVSPIAWYAETLEETLMLAAASAEVTHNHPEGIKGATVVAGAIFLARKGESKDEIRAFVEKYYSIDFTIEGIRPTYDFDVTCQGSVPQAMVAFLDSNSFEDCIRNAVSLGGDSDTIAAMAGGVAEAFYGMKQKEINYALSNLDASIIRIVDRFCRKYVKK